jgi:hypothetical protein
LKLRVEIEVNGDSRSTNERGPSLVESLGSLCRYKRFLSCFGCCGRPSTKKFFRKVHYFISFVPSPSKLGKQSCWVACLLMCVSVRHTTVKKGLPFSRPQPGCHGPNSPWTGIIKFFPFRESLVSDVPSGDGKILNLFLQ